MVTFKKPIWLKFGCHRYRYIILTDGIRFPGLHKIFDGWMTLFVKRMCLSDQVQLYLVKRQVLCVSMESVIITITVNTINSHNAVLDTSVYNASTNETELLIMDVCWFLYGPFCHGTLKLDISTLFTTFFLWTCLQFIVLCYYCIIM